MSVQNGMPENRVMSVQRGMAGKLDTEEWIVKRNLDFFVPDGADEGEAKRRTTHLCIAAHQDDIEMMAYAGIATCFARRDRWFAGVTVTDGAGSPRTGAYAACSDEEMKAIRLSEQRKAAAVGEYSFQAQLGVSSAAVKGVGEDVVEALAELIAACAPEVLYTHNPFDKHDTHVAVFRKVLKAIKRVPAERRPRAFYGCELWRGLDWLNDDEKVILDTSAYPNLARALVGVYESQIGGGKRYDLAVEGRRAANATYLASHDCDRLTSVNYAVDLQPLLEGTSLEDFVNERVERFRADVLARVEWGTKA